VFRLFSRKYSKFENEKNRKETTEKEEQNKKSEANARRRS
jgi:hypothetical protein